MTNTIPAVEVMKLADKLSRLSALYPDDDLNTIVVDVSKADEQTLEVVDLRGPTNRLSFGSHTW